jgi:hypothetical protein
LPTGTSDLLEVSLPTITLSTYGAADAPLSRKGIHAYELPASRALILQKIKGSCGGFLEGNTLVGGVGDISLPLIFEESKADVHAESGTYKDEVCVVLDYKGPSTHYKAWVLPGKGYTCIRYEIEHSETRERSNLTDSLQEVIEASDLRQIEGNWVAMAGTKTLDVHGGDGTGVHWVETVARQKVLINPDFEQLHAFRLDDIPNGIKVVISDRPGPIGPIPLEWRDGKIVAVVSDRQLAKIDQDLTAIATAPPVEPNDVIVAASEPAKTGWGWWWAVPGALVIGVLGIALYAKRVLWR